MENTNFYQMAQNIAKDDLKAKIAINSGIGEAMIISKLIKMRKEKGLTQKQLADLVDTKQSAIARIESFKVLPSIEMVIKLFLALDCELVVKDNSEEKVIESSTYCANTNSYKANNLSNWGNYSTNKYGRLVACRR